MKRPSRRTVAIVLALVVVAGFVVARTFRTTTTEISEADAIDRYESATEDDSDDASAADEMAGSAEPEEQAADEIEEQDVADNSAENQAVSGAEETDSSTTVTTSVPEEVTPVVLPLPQPGVYAVTVIGGEQLALAAGADRTYPAEGFVTVAPVACGVDVRTDFVVERWQSIELCEAEAGLELGTERIFHSFFGLDDLLERSCVASPLALDATSWLCENESSVAERAVTAETVMRDVAGASREVVVFMTELVRGDHPDNVELIELWVDVETGVPVREARRYDFVLDTPLGDAGYTEDYVWEVSSLEPIA